MGDGNKLIIRISGTAKEFIAELDKVQKKTKDLENILSKTAKASAAAFVVLAGAVAVATKSFAEYETALVGVGKTTDIQGKQLAKFGKQFQKLSAEIPVSTNELLGIAQAAGQLGVKGEKDLLKFTETVAKLGVATDLSGEQAATALTRILNVTGEGIATIDTFGSVIVALGNNFAATESEIVRVTTEVARSTAVFGVSSAQAAALATALKSVGVQAQLGGSATGRAFRAIDKAVREGGSALENLAVVTGMTGEQLQKTFKEDATEVFQAFINGLGEIQRSGGSTTDALAAFGLKGDEILKVLPVLAKNSELVGRALKTAAVETKNATALNEEAARAFDTLASEAKRLSNNFTNLKTNIGAQLAPQIASLLKSLNKLVRGISELDEETLSLIASFLKWGTIIAGIIASTAAAALAFLKIRAALIAIKSIIPGLIGLVPKIGAAFGATLKGIGGKFLGLISLVELAGDTITVPFDAATASIDDLENKLSSLEGQLNDINAIDLEPTPEQTEFKKDLEEQIQLLKDLKIQKEQGADFGTGELLIRPKAEQGLIPDFGIAEQNVPLRADGEVASNDEFKKKQNEKTKILKGAEEKRLQSAQEANEILLAMNSGAAEEELELIKTFQDLEQQEKDARLIQDDERRELEQENVALKQEEAFDKLNEFLELQEEQRAEYRMLTEENEILSDEQKRQRIEAFQKEEAKDRKNLLKNEKILATQRTKNEQTAFNAKVGLAQASSDAVVAIMGDGALAGFAISKSLAIGLAFINKARADLAINAAGASLPPPLAPGYIAAGLAHNKLLFGISLATIGAQSVASIARMKDGGIVPGTSFSGDKVPVLANSGEIMLNNGQQTELLDIANGGGTGEGSSETEIVLSLRGDLVDFVEAEVNERRATGVSTI